MNPLELRETADTFQELATRIDKLKREILCNKAHIPKEYHALLTQTYLPNMDDMKRMMQEVVDQYQVKTSTQHFALYDYWCIVTDGEKVAGGYTDTYTLASLESLADKMNGTLYFATASFENRNPTDKGFGYKHTPRTRA